MNLDNLREDFPILLKKLNGKAYLDNAATSQKPLCVINAIVDFYKNSNANVHRGAYSLAEEASSLYEAAREKVCKLINAKPEEIVFTSGATEGINLVADTWGKNNIFKGDEILISEVEHHSNLLPWQRLAKKNCATLKYMPLNKKDYTLDWKGCITPKTKLIAISSYSNVLGPIWDHDELKKIINEAKTVGAKLLLDAAQTIPSSRLDMQKLGVDFLVFSGHKMLAETGIGILYINNNIFIEPYKLGGSMVYSTGREESLWKEMPHKLEAGTPPISQVISLGVAIDYLNRIGFEKIREQQVKLVNELIDGLIKRKVKILGNIERMRKDGHLVSFFIDGIHSHDVAGYLDKCGILVRAGHHCAQVLHNVLGVDASIRVSFYLYNTKEEVEMFFTALDKAINYFK